MADIQIVMEVLGQKNIESATKSTINLENRIKSLSKSLEAGRISEEQFSTALKELRRALDKNGKSWQSNKADIDKYVKQLQASNASAEAAKVAQERLNQERQVAATRLALQLQRERELAAEQKRLEAETQRLAARQMELRMRFQEGYAQFVRQRQAMRDLREAYRAGLVDAEQYATQLARIRSVNIGNVASSNQMGVAIQQLGYQVGDFAVQVQSGTNAFVAFGQQATQLVGVLPLIHDRLGMSAKAAIAWSAGLGIAIPILTALAAAWMRQNEAAEKAKEKVKSLSDAYDEIEKFTFDSHLPEVQKVEAAWAATLKLVREYNQENLRRLAGETTKKVVAGTDYNQTLGKMQTLEEGRIARGINAPFTELEQKQYAELEKQIKPVLALKAEMNKLDFSSREALAKSYEQMLVNLEAQDALTENTKQQLNLFAEEAGLPSVIANLAREASDAGAAAITSNIALMSDGIGEYLDSYVAGQKAAYDEFARMEAEAENRKQEMLQNEIDVMIGNINTYMDAHEAGLAELVRNQNELNDAAAELGERLGISFATALSIIRQAKAEAMVGLDAFGGGGDYRYSLPQTIKPEKPKKARGGGGKTPAQQLEEYLKAAEKEVALKRKQVGLTESQARAIELEAKFLEAKVPLDKARIDALVAEEEALRKATEAEDRRKNMIQTFEGIMENAFMSMVDGSQSVEDAFKGMLRSILLEIYRQQVAKPLASGIMQILGFSAKGDVVSNGSYVKAFANGGVVTGPTAFHMQGGVGVMGEAGPEAIMPLKRGANGKLGVEMHGGGGDTINVVQNFSFSANGDESVKKIIAQAAPQIAQMTQQKIMDSRRRGGQMKSVFS